jgi:hypothetical protein
MMDTQEIFERLLATMKTNQEDLLARWEAKMDTTLTTIKEEMQAGMHYIRSELENTNQRTQNLCKELTEANTEKTEPHPGIMQSTEDHQEIPKGEAAVMPVGEPRKQRKVRNLAADRRQKRKERKAENVDPGETRLPPAGRCPAVQKWHGVKEISSGELRHK